MIRRPGMVSMAALFFLASVTLYGSPEDSVTISSWRLSLHASIGTVLDSLADFGVEPDATPDFDAQYDAPRPPNPPGDYIEVYFPHTGGNWPTLLTTEFAVDVSSPLSPDWLFQVATNRPSGTVMVTWDTSRINLLPAGYDIFLKDSTTGTSFSMRGHNSYQFAYTGTRTFRMWATRNASVVSVNARWNLVSVPRIVADRSKSTLFSSATSPAFAFLGAYSASESLESGSGYWLKFPAPQNIIIQGGETPSVDVGLAEGWNLIGSVDHPVDAPSGGIVSSECFGYAGSYTIVNRLEPGKGYWVKASSAGTITIGPALTGTASKIPEGIPSVTVTDALGRSQRLFLADPGSDPGQIGRFELPPLPPRGEFDARFESGGLLGHLGSTLNTRYSARVMIQTDAYPVTVQVSDSRASIEYAIATIEGGDPSTRRSISGAGGKIVIHQPVTGIDIAVSNPQIQKDLVVTHNFPNPFNPSTRISFRLAERSDVRIAFLTPLGQELLVKTHVGAEAGWHEFEFDAGGLGIASGVIFCDVTASGVVSGQHARVISKLLFTK